MFRWFFIWCNIKSASASAPFMKFNLGNGDVNEGINLSDLWRGKGSKRRGFFTFLKQDFGHGLDPSVWGVAE